MKKRILCLNSEIFSPLYLDLFKNDNGNCFFSNLRFLRFLHNFFLERKREMPSSIFYIVLTSWSNFLWIDDFFSFHNGAKKTYISIGKFWEGHKIWTVLWVRQSRNNFFKPTFTPKNEQANSTLLLWNLRLICFHLFGGNWTTKRHVKIKWPLA